MLPELTDLLARARDLAAEEEDPDVQWFCSTCGWLPTHLTERTFADSKIVRVCDSCGTQVESGNETNTTPFDRAYLEHLSVIRVSLLKLLHGVEEEQSKYR